MNINYSEFLNQISTSAREVIESFDQVEFILEADKTVLHECYGESNHSDHEVELALEEVYDLLYANINNLTFTE